MDWSVFAAPRPRELVILRQETFIVVVVEAEEEEEEEEEVVGFRRLIDATSEWLEAPVRTPMYHRLDFPIFNPFNQS